MVVLFKVILPKKRSDIIESDTIIITDTDINKETDSITDDI